MAPADPPTPPLNSSSPSLQAVQEENAVLREQLAALSGTYAEATNFILQAQQLLQSMSDQMVALNHRFLPASRSSSSSSNSTPSPPSGSYQGPISLPSFAAARPQAPGPRPPPSPTTPSTILKVKGYKWSREEKSLYIPGVSPFDQAKLNAHSYQLVLGMLEASSPGFSANLQAQDFFISCTHVGKVEQTGDFYLTCSSQEIADNILTTYNNNRIPGLSIVYGPPSFPQYHSRTGATPPRVSTLNSFEERVHILRSSILLPPPSTRDEFAEMEGVSSGNSNKRPREQSSSDPSTPTRVASGGVSLTSVITGTFSAVGVPVDAGGEGEPRGGGGGGGGGGGSDTSN